jgi:two-component system, chemotaxis family, chemotaxis protein CheY
MKTILLVEDDATLREALREALEERGYKVEMANEGEAALACLQRDPRPSLILLDLMMPGLNGWDFLARRRIDPSLPAIPVVVISGRLLGPERDSVLPADGFVRKPIDMDELLAEVQRHL